MHRLFFIFGGVSPTLPGSMRFVLETLFVLIAVRLVALAFRPVVHARAAKAMSDQKQATRPDIVVTKVAKRHHSRLKWMLIALATCFAAFLGMALLLDYSNELGRKGLIDALIISLLPLPIWIVLTQWIHRFKTEPLRMLTAAFIWGATVASFFSIVANNLVVHFLISHYGRQGVPLGAVLSAPWVEETIKGTFLLFLFFSKSARFDDVIDGIVYATMIGLGFAVMENVFYFGRAIVAGSSALVVGVFVARHVMGPFLHPFFTAMFGIGLGFSQETDNRVVKFIAPVGGFFLAMFLHYAWNLTVLTAIQFPIVYFYFYFVFMLPAFIGTLILIVFQLGREGAIIGERLLPEVQSGILTAEELKRIATVNGRLRATTRALYKGGLKPWLIQRKCHQVASELAFHRFRVAHGTTKRDDALEAAFVQHLRECLPQRVNLKGQPQPA
jgi:RsiW-degrading membrane proteinase PrsW (M82 family)